MIHIIAFTALGLACLAAGIAMVLDDRPTRSRVGRPAGPFVRSDRTRS